MSLFKFKLKKTENEEYYFGLLLNENNGIGLVIKLVNSHIKIIAKEKFTYTDGWEGLTNDVDNIVSNLEQETKTNLNNLILFIYSTLTNEKSKQLKPLYLKKIKELTKELDFKPLGFIECHEAIIHHLEKKDQFALTAILIELNKSNLGVFVYKSGKNVYSQLIARTNNIIDDLQSVFKGRKDSLLLPSRIILYDSSNLDQEATKILTHSWSEEIFIQPPKVEIINQNDLLNELVEVFGNELIKTKHVKQEVKQEVMGFAIGKDVEKLPEKNQPTLPDTKTSPQSKKSNFPTGLKLPSLAMIKNYLPKINLNFNFNNLSYIIIGSLLIVSSLILTEYFLHKATLNIFFPTQKITETFDLKATKNPSTTNSFLISIATSSSKIKENKNTTGKQFVGEKATGEVTLHNFSDGVKIFPKETLLEVNGIKFQLNSEIKVASASEIIIDGGLVKQPGKTKAKITAIVIGPEGNLTKNKRFKIDNLPQSTYFAINDQSLKNGSKKEITTVSKDDLQELKQRILKKAKLEKKLNKDLDLPKKDKLITDLTKVIINKETYSKEVGEKANSVELQAVVNITYYYYNKNDLKDLLYKKITNQVKSGYKLLKENINYKLEKVEKTKNNNTFNTQVSIKAKAIKQINKDKMINKILFKDKTTTNKILKEEFKADGYQLYIYNPLPFLKNRLPVFKKNIDLNISSS